MPSPLSHFVSPLPTTFPFCPFFSPFLLHCPYSFFFFSLLSYSLPKKKKEKTATQAFVKTLSKPKLNINFLSPLKLLKNGEGHFWNTKNSAEAPAHGDSSVHTPYGGRIT